MCLPFEALEVFTYQLMWVASASYTSVLAPSRLLATATAVICCMHYCVGTKTHCDLQQLLDLFYYPFVLRAALEYIFVPF